MAVDADWSRGHARQRDIEQVSPFGEKRGCHTPRVTDSA
jgi:hypothetical protein